MCAGEKTEMTQLRLKLPTGLVLLDHPSAAEPAVPEERTASQWSEETLGEQDAIHKALCVLAVAAFLLLLAVAFQYKRVEGILQGMLS